MNCYIVWNKKMILTRDFSLPLPTIFGLILWKKLPSDENRKQIDFALLWYFVDAWPLPVQVLL